MIDTDKYEGHNDPPWRTAEGQPYDDEGSHLDIVDANGVLVTETSYFTDNDHPNARLIADAPLLLEEVKRLRKENKTLWKGLMLAESALGEVRAYHENGQGELGEILEHYRDKEGVEMPNAFDEVIE